jgi:hypothetical protein
MKSIRNPLFVVIALAAASFAQSHDHKPADKVAPTEAQQAFDKLKTVAGSWEARVTTTPVAPDMQGKTMHVTLRTTSMGNALLHEMTGADRPDDPITMFYLDSDHLMLTHYCDAGNRPRMTGKISPDGKTVDFEFVDVVGNLQYGHMHHATFTFIDENHHIEDWTYMRPGDKPIIAHFDLQRTNATRAGK